MRTASNLNAPPFLSFSESWTSFCQKLLLFFYLGKEKCGKVFVFSSCASTYDVVLNSIVSNMPKEEMCGSKTTMVWRNSLSLLLTHSPLSLFECMYFLTLYKTFNVTEKVAAAALWVLSSNQLFHHKVLKKVMKYKMKIDYLLNCMLHIYFTKVLL